MCSSSNNIGRVLVIGAGMAGLGAARVLHDAGVDVTVIEARDHIGGRTQTSHLWPDLPVDLGASWIHGTTRNPLTALARATGVKVIATSYTRSICLDGSGNRVAFLPAAAQAQALVEAARKAVKGCNSDMSLRDAVEAHPQWRALSAARRAALRLAINTRIEHEYAGDWSLLSARSFDDGKDFSGLQAVLTPGYGPIVAHLARGLDLRLNEPVQTIAPFARGVAVTTAHGTHRADMAIITLPLGVLQSGAVHFSEALSASRQRAIDGLGMGLLNKCWMRFDRVFWPHDIDWIEFLGPAENHWADWLSAAPSTGQPLLSGFNAAKVADQIETLDNRETIASAMTALRAMFGTAVPDPIGAQITRWRRDPFARGSYSFQAVGSSNADRQALFGPDWDGRLRFAGEATSSDYPGTAHGALMTGRSVAQSLLWSAQPMDAADQRE